MLDIKNRKQHTSDLKKHSCGHPPKNCWSPLLKNKENIKYINEFIFFTKHHDDKKYLTKILKSV